MKIDKPTKVTVDLSKIAEVDEIDIGITDVVKLMSDSQELDTLIRKYPYSLPICLGGVLNPNTSSETLGLSYPSFP